MQQQRQDEELRARIAELENAAENRRIEMENAGSRAEAALALSGIFKAADEAADLYKESLRIRGEETEKICAGKIREAERRAAEIIEAAEEEKNGTFTQENAGGQKVNYMAYSLFDEDPELRNLLGEME